MEENIKGGKENGSLKGGVDGEFERKTNHSVI